MRRFLNNLSNELNQLGDQFQRQGAGGFPNPNNPQQQQYGYPPPGPHPPLQQQYGYPQQQQYGYQQPPPPPPPPPPPQQYGYQPRPGQQPVQQPQQPLQYQPPPPQQQPQYGYQPTPSPQQQQVHQPQHYQPPQPTAPHQQVHQPQHQSPHAAVELPAHTQPQSPPPQQQQGHQPQYPYQAPPVELPAQYPPRPVELPAQYHQPPPQPQPPIQQLQRNTSTSLSDVGLFSLANKLTKSLTSSPLTSNLSSSLSSLTSATHLLLSGGPSSCPRKIPQQNLTDWFSLPHPQSGLLLPNFNICPACFNSLIRPTAYSKFFVSRNGSLIQGNPPVRCDLSRYWVRLAGTVLLAMPGLGHDITLLPRVAGLRTADGMDCPNQMLTSENDALAVAARKNWYSVLDPTTGQPMQGFMICESCVGNISTILPSLAGGFVPLRPPPGQENTGISGSCALVPSDHYDDARTAEVLRQLCVCVGGGIMFGGLTGGSGGGITQFAGWLREHPPRPRGQTQTSGAGMTVGLGSSYSPLGQMQGQSQAQTNGICPRHVSPPGVPPGGYTLQGFSEFTVCEGCYNEVIKPDAEKGADLARRFVVIPGPMTPSAVPGGFACQLYSDRMRRVWGDAVVAGEPGRQILMGKVSERRAKERELQLKATALRQQAAQLRQQAELQEHLAINAMSVAANHASNNIMLHGIGGRDPTGYGPNSWEARMNSGVPDFSQTTKLNNEAAKLKMQAAQVESEIAMVGDEWRRFWE